MKERFSKQNRIAKVRMKGLTQRSRAFEGGVLRLKHQYGVQSLRFVFHPQVHSLSRSFELTHSDFQPLFRKIAQQVFYDFRN